MNKVVIIGNGFDLAHNLKTSYSHFIVCYFKKAISESYKQNIFNDSPIFVKNEMKFNHGTKDHDEFLNGLNSISEIFGNRHVKHNLPQHQGAPNIGMRTEMFKIEINSEFLKRLFAKGNIQNWVDIEIEYYTFLIELINDPKGRNKNTQIQKLNSDFDFISKLLREYLSDIQKSADLSFVKVNSEFTNKMIELIYPRQIYNTGKVGAKFSSVILNFNYTNTIDNYLNRNPHDYNIEKLNIHGSILPGDEFIFGFGHVPGDKYNRIENFGLDDAQKNLKVFNYFNNNAFEKFTSFIEKDDFEVIVLGHSCGESDGSILSRLFNNKNCTKVSVCHYKRDEFQTKLIQIKKHCPNPEERIFNLIKPFSDELSIPQWVLPSENIK